MRPLLNMDTIQIEITDACINSCSNCTRFCGHRSPFFMDLDFFKKSINTMCNYPKMTGIMGGEPLLHPKFKEICEYAQTVLPPERLGLWTCLPPGKEHLREVICKTFGHIFINDHVLDCIYHAPILVASEEIISDRKKLFYIIDSCWIQNSWSACINPNGAFFCEIAGAMSILFDGPKGWEIENEWWARIPKDFTSQVEEWCPKCGAAMPLPRRSSLDGRDDISPGNLKRLIACGSRKITKGDYVVSDLQLIQNVDDHYPMAAYKDIVTRQMAADRYGIILYHNEMNFLSPILRKNYNAVNTFKVERGSVEEHCRVD